MIRKSAALAVVTILVILTSGCTVPQLTAWMDAQGIDHSSLSDQQLEDAAAVATAWWEAAATTTTTTAPPPAHVSPGLPPFLVCVRWRESRGDYTAYNPSSGASGAFQFLRQTWDNTARHAGRYDLVGVNVRWVSPADQDAMAVHLLNWYGRSPWAGDGC